MKKSIKSIKCPACGSRLIDASEGAVNQTVVCVAESSVEYSPTETVFLQKCHKCGRVIELKKGPMRKDHIKSSGAKSL